MKRVWIILASVILFKIVYTGLDYASLYLSKIGIHAYFTNLELLRRSVITAIAVATATAVSFYIKDRIQWHPHFVIIVVLAIAALYPTSLQISASPTYKYTNTIKQQIDGLVATFQVMDEGDTDYLWNDHYKAISIIERDEDQLAIEFKLNHAGISIFKKMIKEHSNMNLGLFIGETLVWEEKVKNFDSQTHINVPLDFPSEEMRVLAMRIKLLCPIGTAEEGVTH